MIRLQSYIFKLIVFSIITVGFVIPISAQESEGTIELNEIVVEGEQESGESSSEDFVASKATAGSKTNTHIEEIPQAVSVISREELNIRGVQKIDEALLYSSGVLAQPFGSDTDTDWVYLRGFDATQTGMFLDGLQLYNYAFGGIITDSYLIDRVEVLKGPASVLYGGSSTGGIVNSVSKRANGEEFYNFELGVTDEPNGYGAFDIGNTFGEKSPWSYRLAGRVKGGETQTEYADNIRFVINPSIHYEPDNSTSLDIYSTYEYDNQRHVGGFLPFVGTVEEATYGYIPQDLYYSEPDLDEFKAQQYSTGFDIKQNIGDLATLRSNTRFIHVERSEYGPYIYDWDTSDNTLNRLNFAHDTNVNLVESDNQAILNFDTWILNHELLMGLNYQFYSINQWQATGSANELDPINPVYTNILGDLDDPYTDEVLSMNKFGTYVQDKITIADRLILTLNGRYDSYWIDREDRTSSDADYTGQYDSFSGRGGVAYLFDFGLTPYASVSHFFEPQIGTDNNGNPIDAMNGEQYEVGLKYQLGVIPALITVSAFDLTRRNELQSVYDWDTFSYAYYTLGEVHSKGIEIEAKITPIKGLNVTGGFTWQDMEIVNDANESFINNQPAIVSPVMASAYVDYTIAKGSIKGLGFGTGIRYHSDFYGENTNTEEISGATVLDGSLQYKRDIWGLSLSMTNILDTTYVLGKQYSYSYGEGRKAQLMFNISL